MNSKVLCIVAVAVAVVAGSVSAIILTVKRADIVRAQAEIAASNEEVAIQERKAKEKEAELQKAANAKIESEAKLKREQAKLVEEETRKAAEEAKLAEIERKTAEAKVKAASVEREKAELIRDSQRLALKVADATNKTLAASVRLAEAKAKSDEAKALQEKLKNERELASIKALELKKIDFDSLEQHLAEWTQDLEARERAIAPEKSISDLSWVGDGNDSVLDDKGNVVRTVKARRLPENDRRISKTSRELARMQRLAEESETNRVANARNAIVSALERLYVDSLKADRPIDADYYAKSIRFMYPDWKYKGEPDAGK